MLGEASLFSTLNRTGRCMDGWIMGPVKRPEILCSHKATGKNKPTHNLIDFLISSDTYNNFYYNYLFSCSSSECFSLILSTETCLLYELLFLQG